MSRIAAAFLLPTLATILVTGGAACGSPTPASDAGVGGGTTTGGGSVSGGGAATGGGTANGGGTTSGGGSASGGGTGGQDAGNMTHITGTLGLLGVAQPTVSSYVIYNSGETLIYMSSAPLTCTTLKTSRWLGSIASGAQVVEVIVSRSPTVKTYPVPPGEVNYAAGGASSAGEVGADTGSITFTSVSGLVSLDGGPVEGSFTGTFADGNVLNGNFHAEFCPGGQGY